jgi:cation transport ATPase
VFRKQKSPDSEAAKAEAQAEPTQAGKGRATPTRREAELARKQRLSGMSGNPKADRRESRRADFEAQTERQHGGVVKQYARDYTDQRFRIAEFFILFAVLLFVLAGIQNATAQLLSLSLWVVMLIAIVIDSIFLVRGVKKGLRERYPTQDQGRIGMYVLMRSMQFRKWRLPKPRLKRGEKF